MSYDPNRNTSQGWGDTNESDSQSLKNKIIVGLLHDFHLEADYGANWSSFDSNTDLPSSPSGGRVVSRVNTNGTGGSMRSFKYDDNSSVWRYIDWNDGSVGTA